MTRDRLGCRAVLRSDGWPRKWAPSLPQCRVSRASGTSCSPAMVACHVIGTHHPSSSITFCSATSVTYISILRLTSSTAVVLCGFDRRTSQQHLSLPSLLSSPTHGLDMFGLAGSPLYTCCPSKEHFLDTSVLLPQTNIPRLFACQPQMPVRCCRLRFPSCVLQHILHAYLTRHLRCTI